MPGLAASNGNRTVNVRAAGGPWRMKINHTTEISFYLAKAA